MNKEFEKLFHVLAAMFLIRERNAQNREDHGAAVAYANAYDWLCYAVEKNKECLLQFDDIDEAIDFVYNHQNIPIEEFENLFKTNE